ncbi:hypothetical protein Tco_1371142 [Tanacetum coccineum]
MISTGSSIKKLKFICHWANPLKDFERSNVLGIKLSSFSKSDDTFTSLQALSNLHYLFSGFKDYFWSCELNISNFGQANRPNSDALRKCILKGPYTPTIVTAPAVPATEDSPAVPEQTTVKTVMNMTPENRAHFESEKEAIRLILTGIGDEIYSTVDACQTAQEMWEAIERI